MSGRVQWRAALTQFIPLAEQAGAEWMLVGSAASAVRGAEIDPGDVDILARFPEDVFKLARVLERFAIEKATTQDAGQFLSAADQPVLVFAGGNWTFGRWLLHGTRVEVASIREPGHEHRLIETAGEEVWRCREVISWEGLSLPIVPLEIQLATLVSRRYEGRVQQVTQTLALGGCRSELLRKALADRDVGGDLLAQYPEINRLLSQSAAP